MNFKVISTETRADTKFALLKGKISILSIGLNIFTGSEASQLIDDLLEAKESGINLRDLFSKIKGLEFLAFESKPVVDQTTDERSQLTSAQKSIYTCLDKLSKKNKAKIQEVLARDFEKLGFKTKEYKAKEPGWLGTELRIAAINGNGPEIEQLLKNGADIEEKDNYGSTALMCAAWKGKAACVDMLLKTGANLEAKDNYGWTALMKAVWEGKDECVDLLLKAGAKIEETSSNGWTALIFAAIRGKDDCIDILLKAGAKIDGTDNDGGTALMNAAFFGNDGCVDLLLKAGSDIDLKDNDGKTALDLAKKNNHIEVVRLLEAAMADQS